MNYCKFEDVLCGMGGVVNALIPNAPIPQYVDYKITHQLNTPEIALEMYAGLLAERSEAAVRQLKSGTFKGIAHHLHLIMVGFRVYARYRPDAVIAARELEQSLIHDVFPEIDKDLVEEVADRYLTAAHNSSNDDE